MANPLKILTALSGTQGANIAGGLTVSTGITTVGALTASSAQLTTVDINGGTIDSATIAASDITVGSGKTLNVSAGTLTLAAGQVGADKVGAGTFNVGTFSFNGSTISDLGTVTTADINGGTIDGASIGAASQSTGKFTSISGSGALEVGGAATLAGGLTVTGAQLNASTVAVSASAVSASSYIGNGSGLSGVIAAGVTANSVALGTDTTGNYVQSVSATANSGIEITNGAAAEGSQPTVGLKNADSLSSNKVLKWDNTNNQLVDSNITDDGNKVELSTALTGTAAYFSQNLTVVGTASFGLLNVINQQSLNVGDKYIVISSGSTDHAGLEGAGMLWGSGAVGGTLFPDAAAHAAIVYRNSNDRLEIFPGVSSSYVTASQLNVAGLAKFDGNVTLGNSTSDSVTVNSTLSVLNSTELSGAVSFKSDENLSIGQSVIITTASLNSLTGAIKGIIDAVGGALQSTLTSGQVEATYRGLRLAHSCSFETNNRAIVNFNLAEEIGQNRLLSSNSGGDVICNASAIFSISGSSRAEVSEQLAYLSIDVATRASGSLIWTNDLVSVQADAVESGSSGKYFPQITIDAPGLGEGNGNHKVRLVVVNENPQLFVLQ